MGTSPNAPAQTAAGPPPCARWAPAAWGPPCNEGGSSALADNRTSGGTPQARRGADNLRTCARLRVTCLNYPAQPQAEALQSATGAHFPGPTQEPTPSDHFSP